MLPATVRPDIDLRLVRYFVVVAGHLHFGRAAGELHITQPSLSRQIRRLEEQVGARLLDRTPRGTRLTDAGEVFLPRAKTLLRTAAQAMGQARAAARPARLVVGYTAGLIVTPAVREVRRRHPDAEVRTVSLAWHDARAALLEHRADAVMTRLPLRTDQLQVTVLYDEPRVLVVSREHRLAGRDSVRLDDFAGEPIPRMRGVDPAWSAFWRLDPRPDGSRPPDGPYISNFEDKFESVAAGEAVIVTASQRPGALRPDLVAIPLLDVDPSHVVLATRAEDRGRLLSTLRRSARTHLTRRPGNPAADG
ncbi:LysR family transcriptional regulator [Streptomyces sp. NPDC007088]|uniref:LysR family transcriptional regulator n=1 Tax=Streptomyces sp. NPDC007088 TaxID=3364773 RepID=UPI0036CF4E10